MIAQEPAAPPEQTQLVLSTNGGQSMHRLIATSNIAIKWCCRSRLQVLAEQSIVIREPGS